MLVATALGSYGRVTAAYCLAALLVVMFPANVRAARAGLRIAGRQAPALLPRFLLQAAWISLLIWVAA